MNSFILNRLSVLGAVELSAIASVGHVNPAQEFVTLLNRKLPKAFQ